MDSQMLFAALRGALAELYPKEEDARVVVDDAGVDASQIAFSTRAQTNWHNILAEAARQNRLDNLLDAARIAYGSNPALTAAHVEYRQFTDSGRYIDPPDQLPTGGTCVASQGNFIGHDQTTAGDISFSSGVAIGPGATANVTIQQTVSEADIRDRENRRTLRQMVRKYWIEGVLEHSLNHEAAIRLNIADHSTLVENRPWKIIPQLSDDALQLLPPNTHIVDVFDQMNQRLLILGEPGAGKTTLLLELARVLLKRADEILTYPSPVVFNLSSWSQRKAPLGEWLVDELRIRYSIPKKVAQVWVENDKLLPLLDGLDEVQAEHRAACAQAINEFRQNHLVPMVVCSRMAEYEGLDVHLKLQGAVLLHPLTAEQIMAYLTNAGPSLAALSSAIQQDTELRELAQSPLMLSIMALAYQDVSPAELRLPNGSQTRRQHLFNTYIQRMFVRREIEQVYSPRQTVRWLHWLAARLVQHGQTIFLIEWMQPDWLHSNKQNSSALSSIMLLAGPVYGLIFGLVFGLIYGLFAGLSDGLIVGLSSGLFIGLSGGIADRLSGGFKKNKSHRTIKYVKEKIRKQPLRYTFLGTIFRAEWCPKWWTTFGADSWATFWAKWRVEWWIQGN